MVKPDESKVMFARNRCSLLLKATRDAIRIRVYGMNPLLVLRPKDVEILLAELIEWRVELLETIDRHPLPQQQVTESAVGTRTAEYVHTASLGIRGPRHINAAHAPLASQDPRRR
jgi:hypothetical protein